MPEVICTTVYQFPELSDAAKDKARSWYRELGPHASLDAGSVIASGTEGGRVELRAAVHSAQPRQQREAVRHRNAGHDIGKDPLATDVHGAGNGDAGDARTSTSTTN